MSEITVRANIKTILNTVANVGNVYDYQRWAASYDDYVSIYSARIKGDTVVRGWTISCEAAIFEGFIAGGAFNQTNSVTYRYKIRGYAGLDDANCSENDFLVTVRAVQDALITSTFDVSTIIKAGLPQLDPYGWSMLGGVLVHYAEITQEITEAC